MTNKTFKFSVEQINEGGSVIFSDSVINCQNRESALVLARHIIIHDIAPLMDEGDTVKITEII